MGGRTVTDTSGGTVTGVRDSFDEQDGEQLKERDGRLSAGTRNRGTETVPWVMFRA